MNIAILMGNLTRDPEMKHTGSNNAVANFAVAVNEKWTDKSGEKKERVAFIDCEAWGKTAENIARFFTKGKPIIVEGRLKQDTWDDKATGAKRSKLLVTVDTFHFVGSGKGEGGAAPARAATGGGLPPIDDESVPF